MKWTKDHPTKNGYYWYKPKDHASFEARIVEYDALHGIFERDYWECLSRYDGEFSSEPISKPQ